MGALSDDAVWRLSVWRRLTFIVNIGPKSRTERPRKTKIGTDVAHVTRDSDTTFKVKRSRVSEHRRSKTQGRGHIVAAASCTACIYSILADAGDHSYKWNLWQNDSMCCVFCEFVCLCTVSLMRCIFPSVFWHCWLGDRKVIRTVQSWVLVCWWWWFDWSFACLTAPVVTTKIKSNQSTFVKCHKSRANRRRVRRTLKSNQITSIILSLASIKPADPDLPGKMTVKTTRDVNFSVKWQMFQRTFRRRSCTATSSTARAFIGRSSAVTTATASSTISSISDTNTSVCGISSLRVTISAVLVKLKKWIFCFLMSLTWRVSDRDGSRNTWRYVVDKDMNDCLLKPSDAIRMEMIRGRLSNSSNSGAGSWTRSVRFWWRLPQAYPGELSCLFVPCLDRTYSAQRFFIFS